MRLSLAMRRTALAAQGVLAAGLIAIGPAGWIPGLLVLIPLWPMWRGSAYAHAANSLLVLVVLGGLLVFREQMLVRLLCLVAAADFVACVLYVRWSARERAAAGKD